MTNIDFAPIVSGLTALIGLVLTTLVGIYVPKAIAAFQARTGIQLTDQQRASVAAAAATAAGIIQTKLDQGVLRVRDIEAGNVTVMQQAQAAVGRVPEAAAALKTTPAAMAQIIVGRVDTSPAAVAVIPPPDPPGPRPA